MKQSTAQLIDEQYALPTTLYFFKNSPYHNDILIKTITNLDQNLEVFNEIFELENVILKNNSSVSILHINGLNEAKDFLEIAHKLSSELKTGNHRILLTIENLEESLKSKFSQIRYLEVTPKNLSPLFMVAKLERHLKLTHLIKEEPSFAAQHSENKLIHMVQPLKEIYDTWVLTNTQQIQKTLTQWTLYLLGPSPEEGRWLVAGEQLWKWVYKDKSGSLDLNGNWFYSGQRPIFKDALWTFTGSDPKLYFAQNDKTLAIKIKCSANKDSLEIAKNKKTTEKYWNKNKKFTDPLKVTNKNSIFTPIIENKGIQKVFKESSQENCEADVWLGGSPQPLQGSIHFYDPESNSFSIQMKSKSQTDKLIERLDTLHESQLYLSIKLKRGRLFFKSALIGRVQSKLTLLTPEKLFEVQRRRNFRFDFHKSELINTVFTLKSTNTKPISGLIKNISSGGCALLISKEHQINIFPHIQVNELTFTLKDKNFKVNGTLKHSEFFNFEKNRYLLIGVQFSNLHPNEIQFLDFFVFEKSREYFLSWL